MNKLIKLFILPWLFIATCTPASGAPGAPAAHDDTVAASDEWAPWNQPQAPFQIADNTWYVGTSALSSVLITGTGGHILIDGALPQSSAQIERNIAALGFRMVDVKLILSSHAHLDHAGGIAALQRASGALVAGSMSTAKVLESGIGALDDPFYRADRPSVLPKASPVKVVRDGETLTVGTLAVTAHMTPGHTPGGTSWSWQSCGEGGCLNIVFADSLNPVSSENFHFSGDARSPDVSAGFRSSIAMIAALPCDIVLSAHPDTSDMLGKLSGRGDWHNPFIDPRGCRVYAAKFDALLTERLARERQEKLIPTRP